ncbi:hypothetical protein CPC08DRAFT_824153 [Agrocybe pediades]|nr:hypothetical protein CPC08DRAFT_824153 [Agrocybe pediades]
MDEGGNHDQEAQYVNILWDKFTKDMQDPRTITRGLVDQVERVPEPVAGFSSSALHWVLKGDPCIPCVLRFPAVLDLRGDYGRIGKHFNQESADTIDVNNLHKIRADFELKTLPDIKDVEGKQVYPSEAVKCSEMAFNFFLLLMVLHEKQKNQGIPEEERPVAYGVSRKYGNAKRPIKTNLIVSSLPFFTDVEDPSTVDDTIPDVDIQLLDGQDTSELLANEAFTQKLRGNVAEDADSALDHGLTLDDLAKESSRYGLLTLKGYGSKKLRAPRVLDANGDLILPTEYRSKLRHETPVMVDVQMRVWEFEGTPHASSGSPIRQRQQAIKNGHRRYQLILNSMTLLAPCAPESPSKRKAESSGSSHSRRAPVYLQSPTPSGSKRGRH